MPRRARFVIPDVPVHLVQRGHNKRPCFFNNGDCEFYLHWLEILAKESSCQVHAFVLMTNHVHFAITPHEHDGLPHLMKSLHQRYAGYINKKYGRSGTIWEGRYRLCIIFDGTYFLTCMRYIELNPVRAGMVNHPRDYRWSSYRTNAEGATSSFIDPHPLYLSLGESEVDRLVNYRRFVAATPDDEVTETLRRATRSNCIVGDPGDDSALPVPGKKGRPHK
ncbi:transposase [Massilia sp. SR12]